jgi:hypothetical protein
MRSRRTLEGRLLVWSDAVLSIIPDMGAKGHVSVQMYTLGGIL